MKICEKGINEYNAYLHCSYYILTEIFTEELFNIIVWVV